MKLRNIEDVEKFREVIRECNADVLLQSPQGDVFNLKSTLSQYIALGRLLSEQGEELELFARDREDERRLLSFLASIR
ncbi:polya polymerase [Chakrabartyella piscis]|uniref:polya polymerase n=1 Tax=Chakrabartyella piscis TaxID=2918914 RepID=UPI0029587533|nr:polya polymerase [Chakrabartyella piscis]